MSGQLANGSFDIEFSLWNAVSDGSQIGPTLAINNLSVVDGRLTVDLDFGAAPFDNSGRWLNIVVNGTTLEPRQPIHRSPYALQTRGIVVTENGNVGIGLPNPGFRLDVNGRSRIRQGIYSSSGIYFWQNGPAADRGFVGMLNDNTIGLWGSEGAGWGLVMNNASANVGIGTTSPSHRLHVVTLNAASGARAIFGLASASGTALSYGVYGQSNSSNGRGVFGMGEFGVYGQGTTAVYGFAPATTGVTYGAYGQSNSTTGRGVFGYAANSNGVNYGVMGWSNSASGYDFFAGGAGINYGSSSSIRWKRNIASIQDPLTIIAQLNGVRFRWDDKHGGQPDIGFIAEHVGTILPEVVGYEENGIDAIGMDYSKLTPLLVEAIKALRTEKDAEIESLHARIESLERIVQALDRVNRSATHQGDVQ
ncbi:MAG TPA: tail fiber domain-containing protein [Phycisphaerales bacterium]|nr:tail fiber domain-containing protein [Phycisphaerales bacterium]